MKKIDNNGLMMCDIQSEVFVESLNLPCSSEVFIRRFMNSKMAVEFDNTQILKENLTAKSIIEKIIDEYGKSTYGKIKYSKEELFWIGHFYRYFSCIHCISSKQAYKIIKPKELRKLFASYHTMGTFQAIERVLEAKNISFSDDYTEDLLALLRKYNANIDTHKMNLYDSSFNLIKCGDKTIEMRLNDDKRKKIKINDVIIFQNTSTKEKIKVKVTNLYKYNDFKELYANHNKKSLGYKSDEVSNPNDMLNYYSVSDIKEYGVLGIEIKIL